MKMIARRHFLKSLPILAAGTLTPAVALEPIARTGTPRMRLSLAAYSMRQFLPNYRGNPRPAAKPLDMLKFIDFCAGLDLDAVELTSYFLPDPCPAELVNEIKRRCHVLGLDISGGAIGNNFSYPEGPELDKQFAYTERWIKTYAAMGVPVIRVFAGHPKKGADERAAVKNIIRNLKRACDIAAEHGVILGMENHDFTTHIDRYLEILAAVDSPWLGANLDSGNLANTADPYADLARIAPYTVNAQIKVEIPVNGKREPADYSRLIAILKNAGYRGYVVLEYEAKDPYTEIPRHLKALRSAIDRV